MKLNKFAVCMYLSFWSYSNINGHNINKTTHLQPISLPLSLAHISRLASISSSLYHSFLFHQASEKCVFQRNMRINRLQQSATKCWICQDYDLCCSFGGCCFCVTFSLSLWSLCFCCWNSVDLFLLFVFFSICYYSTLTVSLLHHLLYSIKITERWCRWASFEWFYLVPF